MREAAASPSFAIAHSKTGAVEAAAAAAPWPMRWLGRRRSAFPSAPVVAAPSTRLLVLQPTPFCNLDCSYCYLPDRDVTHRMSLPTVRQAAQRLRDDALVGDELTVVWHAGEPLAVPIDFYREAFAVMAEVLGPRTQVNHAMQTNATLIDAAWCRLFSEHRVRVGVSIDGPAGLHDRHRRTRNGKPTHAKVLHGLQQLRAQGIAFHAIAVVTRDTLAEPDAFFDFFLEQGIHDLGCNFDEAEGLHARSSLADSEAAHARFLERLLQRSVASGSQVVVRELASAHQHIAQALPQYTWQGRQWPDNAQVRPLALISVAWNGDFSSFSPELLGQPCAEYGDFVLGNVATGSYRDALQSPAMQALWPALAAGLEACERECAYFAFCGGGAPANKWYENANLASTETLYCRSMVQRPLDTVLRRLEQERGTAPAASSP